MTFDRSFRIDMGVFVSSLLMLGLGIVLVYSSSFAVAQARFGGADFFLERQVVRVLIGLLCFVVFMNIDYHFWCKISTYLYFGSVGLLIFVLMLPAHHAINGAKRWINLGPISFQVSELACMALIFLLAERCGRLGQEIRLFKKMVPDLCKVGLVAILVLMEPNFSTALIVSVVGLGMIFMSGARIKHISLLILGALPVAIAGFLAAPYRRARLLSYLKPGEHAQTVGYQAYQALVGLGNGGLWGVGLGESKQKLFYLPEPHTDFAFSILGEELGFIGLLAVLSLFAFLIWRGFRIAQSAPDKQGQLLAFGFSCLIAVYVIVHAAVNVGIAPTTGVPLPFLSYGGMSLIFTMSSIGILLNVSSQSKKSSRAVVAQQKERLNKFQP